MKHLLLLTLIAYSMDSYAQESRSMIPTIHSNTASKGYLGKSTHALIVGTPATETDSVIYLTSKLPTIGLIGIANTNTESFNNINSSGKLSGYIRPWKHDNKKIPYVGQYIEADFSFNLNASNTDSLLANTFLFPDVGSNAFSGSLGYNLVLGKNSDYYIINPYMQFASKNIKGRLMDSVRTFATNNFVLGVNFAYMFVTDNDRVSLGVSPYLAWAAVPQNDKKDYKYLFTGDETSHLATNVHSWGIKTTLQYNLFQIFADFRTVTGSSDELSVVGLKGFHTNLGIVFTSQIVEK